MNYSIIDRLPLAFAFSALLFALYFSACFLFALYWNRFVIKK